MPGPDDYIERSRSVASGATAKAVGGAFSELGVGSTISFGGVVGTQERNAKLNGTRRWQTAQDILVNMSIVAAGVRFYLNLLARPTWKVDPVDDSAPAKEAADFVESLIHSTDTSWTRIVRRNGIFKFHGYGLHEWVAKRRDDGKIGFRSIEPRMPVTITRWDMDEHNSVKGVWQRPVDRGNEIYLPREKLIYLVDDALTDSPEGMGWFRHLAEPTDRMKRFLQLEKIGFERDLQGTPVGRAPYAAIKAGVAAGKISEVDGKKLLAGIEEFVRTQVRQPDTGLMLDSQPFISTSADGSSVTSQLQYGIELLTGQAGSVAELGTAIGRTTWDMAMIMGVERLLVGREGAGSLALSEDTSLNLFLNANSTLGDIAESYDRDLIGPAWALNGFDPKLRPTLKVEDVASKDVAKLAKLLADMASAGAVLAPDDPAIDDIRDLAGLSRQPEMTPERMGMLMGTNGTEPGTKPGDNPDPDPTNPDAPDPKKPAAKRFNPDQPRDPKGTSTGGQFAGGGDGGATAQDALGEDGLRKVQQLIDDPKATGDQILDALQPASDAAKAIDATVLEGDVPDDGFWIGRRYVGDKTKTETVDALTAQATAYAGPNGVKNEKQAMFIIGSPAAGKSTAAEELARAHGFAIVDSDDAKKQIPEFKGGIGASAVHHESGFLSNDVADRLAENGTNMMFPTVGHSNVSLQRKIDAMKAGGYEVSIVNVSVTPDTAARRMAARYVRSGRLIDTDYFRSIGTRPDATYEHFKAQGYRVAKINGNGAKGKEHVEFSSIPSIASNRSLF